MLANPGPARATYCRESLKAGLLGSACDLAARPSAAVSAPRKPLFWSCLWELEPVINSYVGHRRAGHY